MSIQVDAADLYCFFCGGQKNKLVRSMHGLYCTNENCYTRKTSGNLVPPSICEKCKENSFYLEKEGTVETAMYQCIACGHQEFI